MRALRLSLALAVLSLACGGSSSTWTCNWMCNSTGQSGSHTYPSGGSDPTDQCTAAYGASCNSFTCSCHEN